MFVSRLVSMAQNRTVFTIGILQIISILLLCITVYDYTCYICLGMCHPQPGLPWPISVPDHDGCLSLTDTISNSPHYLLILLTLIHFFATN